MGSARAGSRRAAGLRNQMSTPPSLGIMRDLRQPLPHAHGYAVFYADGLVDVEDAEALGQDEQAVGKRALPGGARHRGRPVGQAPRPPQSGPREREVHQHRRPQRRLRRSPSTRRPPAPRRGPWASWPRSSPERSASAARRAPSRSSLEPFHANFAQMIDPPTSSTGVRGTFAAPLGLREVGNGGQGVAWRT
jgi:hypothetical protein